MSTIRVAIAGATGYSGEELIRLLLQHPQVQLTYLAASAKLVKLDQAHHGGLRGAGMLTRDPRMKERKKYGRKGARRCFQWTKR